MCTRQSSSVLHFEESNLVVMHTDFKNIQRASPLVDVKIDDNVVTAKRVLVT